MLGELLMAVYFLLDRVCGAIKIGYTGNDDVTKRTSSIQTSSPHDLEVIGWVDGDPNLEAELHQKLSAHRIRGEWFHPHPDVQEVIATRLCRDAIGVFGALADQERREYSAKIHAAATSDTLDDLLERGRFEMSHHVHRIASAVSAERWADVVEHAACLISQAQRLASSKPSITRRCSICGERGDAEHHYERGDARICRDCALDAAYSLRDRLCVPEAAE